LTASRRLLLVLLILGGVINYADRQIIAILKPLIAGEFHWTDDDYGHLASAFQFAAAISLLFAGWFVDRVGVKWANPLSVGVWSVIAMAQALARTLFQFGAMRIALGATESMGTPVAVKTIAVLFPPKERSLAFGAMNGATTAGAIVTPLLVPSLAVIIGWRGAFLITGGSGLVWVAAWLLTMGKTLDGLERADASSAPARVRWGEVLRDRRTWAVAGAKALSDQVWWFLLFWAPDLFHRFYHLDIAQTGAPVAIIYGCAVVGAVLGGLGSRRLVIAGMDATRARKRALLICALLATPIALVGVLRGEWLTVGLLGLTLAAHQGFSVNLFALITDVVPARQIATVTGIGAFAGNLGGMGILAFTGWILTTRGDYGPVFLFAASSYLLALLWLHLVLPRPWGASMEIGTLPAAGGRAI
jgi:ACS family hexuronate transporter-like MFS transporter